jgi:hypothetical protein
MFVDYFFFGVYKFYQYQENQWNEFTKEHHCKMVAQISGEIIPTIGITTNGNISFGSGYIPNKTGYLCDDGITYFR